MVLLSCGGYTFNSEFDSGNLGRVEFVRTYEAATIQDGDPNTQQPAAEVNLWTRPDCAGTAYENTNRTWFFFSVKGGLPSGILRMNIMNLNRQAKLYSHGMQPVVKIGANGKWERTKDRPTYRTDEENFVLSFLHRAGEDPSVECFYAFTYPYTYQELQEYLSRLDRRFRKRAFDIQKKSIEENISLFVDQADYDGSFTNVESQPEPPPESSAEMDSGSVSGAELFSEIYYYRELLTYSLEKRRIDLITITDYGGITAEREERIVGLFPETLRHRSHLFQRKKVIFISSRVHPGETPASFVLNGFMRLLLDRKSNIASVLRRSYVFKIVPFLNPDGVASGFYRSDTLGHNLNRVYTNPDPKLHPSIYAVSRLLSFYQSGTDNNTTDRPIDPDSVTTVQTENCCLSEAPILKGHVISLKDLIKNQLNEGRQQRESYGISNEEIKREIPQLLLENDENCTPIRIELMTDGSETPTDRKLVLDGTRTIDSLLSKKKKETTAPAHRLKGKKDFRTRTTKNGLTKCKSTDIVMETIDNFSNIESEIAGAEKDENRNLFLYIDLHGHASKKGVFMYGNFHSHPMQAVECLLLPRLMSMNSAHFHFDACNFSERNMYHRGKRDGLSKEGSGRVAVYKTTGLIKAYTLECNYNTGKYVNVLPARGKSTTPKAGNVVPPKYSPSIFEEVGRALGASILDLSNSNPVSRLGNSEFRTLQGLRNALRLEIERSLTKSQLLPKAGSSTSSRPSTSINRSAATLTRIVPRGIEAGGFRTNSISDSQGMPDTATAGYAKKKRPITRKVNANEKPMGIMNKKLPLLNLVPVKRLKGIQSSGDSSNSGHSGDVSVALSSNSSTTDDGLSSQRVGVTPKGVRIVSSRPSGIPVLKRPAKMIVAISTTLPVPSTSKIRTKATGSGLSGGEANKLRVGVLGGMLKQKRSSKSDIATIKRKSRAKSLK